MLATPSILPNKPTNPAYKAAVSLKPVQETPIMTDADTELAGPLRRKLTRLLKQAERIRDRFLKEREGDVLYVADRAALLEEQEQMQLSKKEYDRGYDSLCDLETNPTAIEEDATAADLFDQYNRLAQIVCKQLISTRKVQSTAQALEMAVEGLNSAFNTAPDKSHVPALAVVLTRSKELEEELMLSPLGEDHPLRGRAAAAMKEAYLIQAKATRDIIPDTKPGKDCKDILKANFKIPPLTVPSFSGRTEDWLPFWRQFSKAVHTKADLDDETRLSYLIQALKDPGMKSTYSERMDDEGAYQSIVAELQAEHDKPRWMHRKYCAAMKNLAPNLDTRAGMKDLINQVTTILKGFIRLKGENCRQILTSMTEAVMSKSLRTLWNQRTDKIKDTPPIEDLLLFIKEQSDQIEDKESPSKQQYEKNKAKPGNKSRGSSHVAVAAQPPAQSSTPSNKGRGAQSQPPPSTSRLICKYVCPLCADNHYAFFCSTFEQYSLAQRKEHVRTHSLCTCCLKPGHTSAVCRSTYKCKTCQGDHNSLLHEGSSTPSAQVNHGSTYVTSSVNVAEAPSTLITTTELMVRGPTGRTIRARALLDGGSGISIISQRLQKTLQLKKTKESILISGVGQATNHTASPLTSVHLSAINSSDWNQHQRVAIMPRVTGDLPMLPASSVRDLPHIKGKELADSHFDIPGRIDLLLGEDALRNVYLPGESKGPPGTPTAWHTVFGWVLRGCYTPDKNETKKKTTVLTTTTAESNQTTDALIVRFWEVEDGPKNANALTPEEEKVQEHYLQTHSYDPQAEKYTVSLPRREGNSTLGDSRTQALNRARSTEKSLIRKGTLDKFQEVIQEYIDLQHAQPVTAQEMTLPPASCYYMPMHGVHKDSSTTTKLRVVFDASAKTTSGTSLNDLLAVGPTLHPTLDKILLKFR